MPITKAEETARDALSFEACYFAHRAKIYHLGLRYGRGNAAWAEDLTHDVFVRFAEKRQDLHSLDDVGAWLYRVASNLAVSRLRREKSFWTRVAVKLGADKHHAQPAVHDAVEEQQLAAKAMAALNRLPAREQVALSMKIIDDKSQKEIADTLSMSEGYVSKLIARALRRIEREGWEVPPC